MGRTIGTSRQPRSSSFLKKIIWFHFVVALFTIYNIIELHHSPLFYDIAATSNDINYYSTPPLNNSTSIDIFWMHIQKTGTSLFNTIYLHFCPSIVINHPDIIKGEKPLYDMALLREYPPTKYCNSTIRNMPSPGHHFPYGFQVKGGDQPYYFTMFRDPMMRLKSAYSYGRHWSKLKNDSISFDTYVNESHIPNCQLKMMLGHHCAADIDPQSLNVTLALERVKSPKFFFGDTDQWGKSICLFHKWFGGTTQPFELKNNRKTKRDDDRVFTNYTFTETLLYNNAREIFDYRVKEVGC